MYNCGSIWGKHRYNLVQNTDDLQDAMQLFIDLWDREKIFLSNIEIVLTLYVTLLKSKSELNKYLNH